MSSYLISHLGYPVKRHVLNTAGIMRYPQYQYDLVRLGIGLYGISPLGDTDSNLRPVSRLTTTISALQHRHSGETVGYSRRGKITGDTIVATLPIGYADGLNRHLGCGNTSLIGNGVECPTVGNICMDICMIDVTRANAVCGDRVEIFGETKPVTTVARTLGTIPYEVLTWVAPRVKRIYYRE
ncbi:MAG: alanine racemase [Muribaculaceae bacterium]|nr:alanine racemase [Muribaculaceae bacterium]